MLLVSSMMGEALEEEEIPMALPSVAGLKAVGLRNLGVHGALMERERERYVYIYIYIYINE